MQKYFPASLIAAFLFIVLLLPACKLGKNSLEATKDRDADFLINKMVTNQVNVEWFSAKIKAKHESEDLSIGFSGNIRMKKDSIIWLNVKKFGFEVARVQIEKDSIFVIDRFNDEFIAEDLQYVQRMVNFPANFSMIQSILLGNPVFFTKNLMAGIENKTYHLKSKEGKEPNSEYILDGQYKILSMEFSEPTKKRWLTVDQAGYSEIQNQNFAHERVLSMDSPDTGKLKVELSFSDVIFNEPTSFPFSKPANY
ncbi:MAG: DUF4292 domain-containing protein [Saprospiraceae bacterium]